MRLGEGGRLLQAGRTRWSALIDWEVEAKMCTELKHPTSTILIHFPGPSLRLFLLQGWGVSYLAVAGTKYGPSLLWMESRYHWMGVINANFDLFLLSTDRALQTQNGSSYEYEGPQ